MHNQKKEKLWISVIFMVSFSNDPIFNDSVVVLKKMKHRIVDTMSSTTADALGLSRAILCNGSINNHCSI